jgi:hypothetical protein
MEKIDNTSHCQHSLKLEVLAEETRSFLQMIRQQVISEVDAETASTGLELEPEHWQRKGATAACRYTWALKL